MWARVVELMLGCWLVVSPFVFGHPSDAASWWTTDLASGAGVMILSLSSFWRPLRYSHLGILAAAAWLVGFGYFAHPHPLPPALQNNLLVGLLLLMFAVVPCRTGHPPEAWQRGAA